MKQFKELLKEVISVLLVSLIIVIPIRMYVAQPFVVSGQSMDKTLADGNYLIVDELSYEFRNPERGDVVVFKVPEEALAMSNYNLDKKMFFIKRIIGLPGETVEIDGDTTKIFNKNNPNGITLNEPYAYLDKLSPNNANIKRIIELDYNEYFVMGDNRNNSSDSRYWGALKKEYIKGRALVRLLPLNNIDILPGEYKSY